ncbi:MAG: dihydroneopterin aldolase [Candidatus Actinomarina sp.]|jgi:dihydroneopterin aldolase|tara:strand:+ start:1176 stop:1544 length:369 start_codon:yes stop_codon:yes gene_type:complete
MSFDIHLSKIECFGKHGIYDNEKDNDQKFLIDIYIKIQDFSEDNIVNTVNYEEVVDLVIKIVEHESFDLIESLSKNIVKQIITRYQKSNVIINEIRATVHKPNTILKSKTEDISVSYFEKLK